MAIILSFYIEQKHETVCVPLSYDEKLCIVIFCFIIVKSYVVSDLYFNFSDAANNVILVFFFFF